MHTRFHHSLTGLFTTVLLLSCEPATIDTRQKDARDTQIVDAGPSDAEAVEMVQADSAAQDLLRTDILTTDQGLMDQGPLDQVPGDLVLVDRDFDDVTATDQGAHDAQPVDGSSSDLTGDLDAGQALNDATLTDSVIPDAILADGNLPDNNVSQDAYVPFDGGCDDDDYDGVCNAQDQCGGFDDHRDADQDGLPDGCDPCPYSSAASCPSPVSCDSCESCSAALQTASEGQTVRLSQDLVAPGTSGSCVSFAGHNNVILDCAGHSIEDSATTYYGVYAPSPGSSNVVIKDCHIKGFKNDGVAMTYGQNNLISGCLIEENGGGINFYAVDDSVIEDNVLRHNSTGVLLRFDADNNLLRGNSIVDNYDLGLDLWPRLDTGDPDNNRIIDNYFRTRDGRNVRALKVYEDPREPADFNIFSASADCGDVNKLGCACSGGNYWAQPDGQGFSQTCADANQDGFCDQAYDFSQETFIMRDLLPLAVPAQTCCANPDKDRDGRLATSCGGDDCDDQPWRCGADCLPGSTESCDRFDNNCDQQIDEGGVCTGDLLSPVLTSYPSIIQSQSCVEDSGSHLIYCFGGMDKIANDQPSTDMITAYNPATDSLRVLTTRLPSIRADMGCAEDSLTHKIYCFGGNWQTFECVGWSDLGGCISGVTQPYISNEILEFDPSDESLTTVATLPAGLDDLVCVENSDNHHIFCFGETDSVGGQFGVIDFVPETGLVEVKLAVLTAARVGESCAEDSDTHMIYCLGGVISGVGTTDEIIRYNPVLDSFSTMTATLPSPRRNTACVADPSTFDIYCFGGAEGGSTYFDTVLRYDPSADSLSTQSARIPYGRHSLSCARDSLSGGIYCFGGGRNVVFFDQIFAYWP